MVEFTVSKAKVAPLYERYIGGGYEPVDETNSDGVKRMAILGLDNSHNKDFKVGLASDPLITIQGSAGVSHDDLQDVLEEFGVWELARFTPIEVPHGTEWRCAFKTSPDRVRMIDRIYEKFELELSEDELLGSPNQFTVYQLQ